MDYPVEVPGVSPGRFVYRTNKMGVALLFDGQRLKVRKNRVTVPTDTGEVEVKLVPRRAGFDVPDLEVGGERVEVVPPLPVWALAWAGLPVLLLFVGGAVGGGIGAGSAYGNTLVMRSGMHWVAKFLVTGLVTVAAVAATILIAGAISVLLFG